LLWLISSLDLLTFVYAWWVATGSAGRGEFSTIA